MSGEELTATLIVSQSSSTCGHCRQQAFPNQETHETLAGWGGGGAGCGARFVAIRAGFTDKPERIHEALTRMRPDLPIEESGLRGLLGGRQEGLVPLVLTTIDAAAEQTWQHHICEACFFSMPWNLQEDGDRIRVQFPSVLLERPQERFCFCCLCTKPTVSGIYIFRDPANMRCFVRETHGKFGLAEVKETAGDGQNGGD